MPDRPTVVFGLDGASYGLVDRWIEAGDLPNLRRVVESGVRGDLESVLPPVTSPNWKAYATGKNPGKIGIYWWENVDVENRRVYYPDERKHENVEFWEIIAESDPVGVLGVPTTYPPKPVDAFLVAGAPDGENDGYAHPPSVEDRLEDDLDYRVLKTGRLADDREAAAEEILELIDLRFRAARRLTEAYDVSFLQVTTFYLNSLHHFLWDDEYTRRGWEIVDDHLGRYLDGECNVVLMSDHGSNRIETAFHVNAWLEREGYLVTDTGVPDLFHRAGITKDRLLRVANALGVGRLARRVAPRTLLNYLPSDEGTVDREGKTENVDWAASDAVASGQGPIYLIPDADDPRYDEVREELVAALADLTDPAGRPVADAVYRGEDVYAGPYLDDAPDVVVDQAPGVHITGGIGRDEPFTDPTADGWRAENKREGLFAATGPDFAEGTVDDLSILDLAPTLLHLHDRPVPEDVDGAVRTSLFAPGSDPAERDVRYRPVDGPARERRRIRRVARRLDL